MVKGIVDPLFDDPPRSEGGGGAFSSGATIGTWRLAEVELRLE